MSAYWIRYRQTHFPLRRAETTIGRSAYCTIVLSNSLASRRHCMLRLSDTGLTVVDLESRNGTYVNERRIHSPTPVVPGDVIRVGSDALEVVDSADADRRAKRSTGTRFDATPEIELDAATGSKMDLVEMLETLVRVEDSAEQASIAAEVVRRTIETMLEQPGRLPNESLQRARLMKVAEAACARMGDASGARWLAGVRTRLGDGEP